MGDSNPFATRFTRPGAIDYLFPADQSAASLVRRLEGHGWWGEITGAHGSGKSTLLAALVPVLRKAGRSVVWRAVRNRESGVGGRESAREPEVVEAKFVAVTAGSDTWNDATQLVLDGYEQLSWWWRRRVQALARRRGAGLLVTAHQSLGLPSLVKTRPSEAVAQEIVARLVADHDGAIAAADVKQAYAAAGGNVRETLFALDDVYQSRRK
jgi:hypothetical protein